ncbi:hypothetical protein BDV93DRAFT_523132 [Ceratobasidium sp. AG-I]|nr:hypothetical protein BDV93DRAFT_523132 [Ceratobasidium sp. AG-I]
MKATPRALEKVGKETRPLLRLAKASTSCATQAKTYGQCILANYQDVRRDMCAAEFVQFKNCVQTAMGRKW